MYVTKKMKTNNNNVYRKINICYLLHNERTSPSFLNLKVKIYFYFTEVENYSYIIN